MSCAVALRPRPVLCVTEHEHRSRAVADGVRAGRFTVAGETRTLGTDPDWLGADLPADEEWRIEWVKFAWGMDLAHAGYQRTWEELTASWIRQVPADADAAEVTARRILNWIYAWQRLTPGEDHAALLLLSVAEQVAHVRAHLAPERNHRTLELYALLVAAIALPELDQDGLLDLAVTELDRNLATDFRSDGVHREASTHYHAIALRSFVGTRENAARYGIELPAGFDARLARACAFAAHCTRPDGTIPALSDADHGDYGRLLVAAADALGDDELRFVGTRGREGRAPAIRHASFPDGGYHVQRSGWRHGARYLIFDCGPLGDGGHGHYDLLSFEAHGGGRPLVVDPGRGSYSEGPPNLRRWFRSTAAHNTVCIDGLDQTPYSRGGPLGPVARGRLLGRGTAPGLDLLAGEAVSPEYEAAHERRIAFVADRYWVIEDRLQGEREHCFDLRFHLAPEAQDAARVDGSTVRAPGLALAILGADAIALEPGWVAPSYGRRLDAPVVNASAVGTTARFVTLLAPRAPGEPAPRLAIDVAGCLRVEIDGARDCIDLRAATCEWERAGARVRVKLA
jgi:Heparinase II/III-like protein/Heparinase II/III N-terminus